MKIKILLLLFFVGFFGCKSLEDGLNAPEAVSFSVSDIQQDYDLKMKAARTQSKDKSTEAKLLKKIKWNKYYAAKKDGEIKLIIPFELEKEIYRKWDNGVTMPYSSFSRLIVTKKGGSYEYEVVTKQVDLEYINSEKTDEPRGMVTVEDIQGNFIKGYLYTKDGIKKLTRGEKNSRTNEPEIVCRYTDWYSCAK